MKKAILITLALPLVASSLVFGLHGTWDRVQAGIAQLRDTANDKSDPDLLLRVARKQYSAAQEKLTAAGSTLTRYEKQTSEVADQITKLERSAATARCRLETLRPALAGANCGMIVIGRCRYSPCEVQAAARSLVGTVQECEAAVVTKSEHLKQLKQAISTGRTALAEAHTEAQKVDSYIRTLAVRLETEAARKDTTSAIAAIKGSVTGELNGDLANTLDTLEKQVANMKRENDSAQGPAAGGSGIAWDEASEPKPVLDFVDSVLKSGGSSQAANGVK